MAYITKAEVQAKTPKLKAIAKKYGVKITVSGSNSSSLTVKITEGKLDFFGASDQINDLSASAMSLREHTHRGYKDINVYWYQERYTGEVLNFLNEIMQVMKEGWYDESDAMTDYFNTAWYNHIKVGSYEKPYVLTE